MSKKIRISTFLVLLLIYISFFGVFIEEEVVYTPVWALDSETASISTTCPSDLIPFKTRGVFGYLDPEGELCFKGQVLYDTALSSSGFINYSRLSETLVLRNTEGEIMESIGVQGYPAFSSDRLLVFSADRSRVSEFSIQGKKLWSRSFRALVTSMDVTEEYILAGLLNGTLLLLSKEGEPIYSVKPGGSRLEAIYGCACTTDASRLAAVSGIDPQKLLLLEKKNEVYRLEEAAVLEEPVRHTVFMQFSPDGEFLLLSIDKKTMLYSVEDARLREVYTDGILEGVHLSDAGELSHFFFRTGPEEALLSVMDIGGSFRDDINVHGGSVYLEGEDNMILLGLGHYFIRIDQEER